MSMRFSKYEIISFYGNDKEILDGAIMLLNRSYCTATSALAFLDRIAQKVDASFKVRCIGDMECIFDSQAITDLPDDWADQFLNRPYIVEVDEDFYNFADSISAKRHVKMHGGRLVNPKRSDRIENWLVWSSTCYGEVGDISDTAGTASFATLRAAWKYYRSQLRVGMAAKPKSKNLNE